MTAEFGSDVSTIVQSPPWTERRRGGDRDDGGDRVRASGRCDEDDEAVAVGKGAVASDAGAAAEAEAPAAPPVVRRLDFDDEPSTGADDATAATPSSSPQHAAAAGRGGAGSGRGHHVPRPVAARDAEEERLGEGSDPLVVSGSLDLSHVEGEMRALCADRAGSGKGRGEEGAGGAVLASPWNTARRSPTAEDWEAGPPAGAGAAAQAQGPPESESVCMERSPSAASDTSSAAAYDADGSATVGDSIRPASRASAAGRAEHAGNGEASPHLRLVYGRPQRVLRATAPLAFVGTSPAPSSVTSTTAASDAADMATPSPAAAVTALPTVLPDAPARRSRWLARQEAPSAKAPTPGTGSTAAAAPLRRRGPLKPSMDVEMPWGRAKVGRHTLHASPAPPPNHVGLQHSRRMAVGARR